MAGQPRSPTSWTWRATPRLPGQILAGESDTPTGGQRPRPAAEVDLPKAAALVLSAWGGP